ncbi:response regulator [Aquabacterium sp. J223]|uniref:hybrid sensor histidine kinase/response regulator n=1 Tax=Aquabacterium sp. J223 TaxID=2898431 RepID=UPI0021ADC69C|nr:response regulator [Aquabacterium sp. J223]UUX94335.1 response regulator [Aquabacterium sp. J223]
MREGTGALAWRSLPLKVLLLEDSRFDAELLGEHLKAHYPAAEMTRVQDEDGFVAALAQGGWDVLLSDYELPGFSGAQALQIAQMVAPRTPFIFVSGVIGEDNAVEMLKRGATDYVSKGRLSRLPVVIDRALGEVADRSARERAESQLREADATFGRVVDSLRGYAVILLDREGCIRSWNRAASEIFAHPPEAVIGRSAELLFLPEDRARGALQEELRVAREQGLASDDRWMQRADGSRLYAEGAVTPLYADDGPLNGYCKVVRDSTAAQQAAAALRQAKEEAERANRAKDRFLAMLSHELRTPLTPIATAARLLERSADVPAAHRSLLPMIQRNVALEARLIDDLLDLTSIAAGKIRLRKAPVNLHELLHAVVEMLAERIQEQQLKIEFDLAAGRAMVEGDEARLQQVLWNVVRNAVKFSAPGGRVRLASENDGNEVLLHCADEGIGIEPDALPRIFTAFEQAEPEVSQRYGGLGLGLAIARGLVVEHGGRLEARSDGRHRGATFTLRLPVLADPQAPSPSGPPADDGRTGQRCRLLLVEDNLDAAEALRLWLEDLGYDTTHATTRAEALALARERHFDAVVSDLGLPDGSGLDLGRELGDRCPVIALSGYGTAQDVRLSSEAGFAGHLVKPVDPQAVHLLVQRLLSQRRT